MLKTKRITQIFLYLMAITSSFMLAMSIGSELLMAVALVGTTLGFVMADWWGRFRIEGWLANIVSIVILVLAMRDFFPSDSAGKLVSVANLLVYLQTVLMFQDKTPRLNWQIMVLSLLQVVITSIFNLNFEGSFLLLVYFLLGGCTMTMQCIYADSIDIHNANESNAQRLQSHLGIGDSFLSQWALHNRTGRAEGSAWAPVAILDSPGYSGWLTTRLLLSLLSLFLVSIVFTVAMLLMAPKQDHPWFSPIVNSVPSTGLQKKIDNLASRGTINLPETLLFRASVSDSKTGESLRLTTPIYFRGMALSSLVIEDGATTWRAPYERLVSELYQKVQKVESVGNVRLANVEVMMEQTRDPLVYGVQPFFANNYTSRSIEFCHEVSAIVRCRDNEQIDLRPFKYGFTTVITPRGGAAKSWPYVSNTRNYRQSPMSHDPAQEAYLTLVDRERYPTLCAIADDIHEKVKSKNGSRIELIRQIENHFLSPGNYRYTLNYRDVQWDPTLDPVEDFAVNVRKGHCSVFASAMTVMLRSQGIPTRMVSGFHGGNFNKLTRQYVVRADHAHAWVEVYLRPEDCNTEMLSNGQAGPGGAWMIGEPTPGVSEDEDGIGTDDAIELARNVWQEYMLGMDESDSMTDLSYAQSVVRFFENVVESDFRTTLVESTRRMSPLTKAGLTFLGGLLLLIPMVRFLIRKADYEEEQPVTTVGKLRRFIADALGLISPDLREWVIGSDSQTEFYVRLETVLKKQGLEREPSQTHREFAKLAASKFEDHPAVELIQNTISQVTETFNQVRFGRSVLETDARREIDQQLDELAKCLG